MQRGCRPWKKSCRNKETVIQTSHHCAKYLVIPAKAGIHNPTVRAELVEAFSEHFDKLNANGVMDSRQRGSTRQQRPA
jgi:hypothetical protein